LDFKFNSKRDLEIVFQELRTFLSHKEKWSKSLKIVTVTLILGI
jgi:hypothetical protein